MSIWSCTELILGKGVVEFCEDIEPHTMEQSLRVGGRRNQKQGVFTITNRDNEFITLVILQPSFTSAIPGCSVDYKSNQGALLQGAKS